MLRTSPILTIQHIVKSIKKQKGKLSSKRRKLIGTILIPVNLYALLASNLQKDYKSPIYHHTIYF